MRRPPPLAAVLMAVVLGAGPSAYASAAGRPSVPAASNPTASGPEPVPGECANAGAADFDGDGFNDVVVGDPLNGDADWMGWGSLYFLRGTPEGFPRVRGVPFRRDGGLPGWIARTGHIDGDRCLDLVVANPFQAGSTSVGDGRYATVRQAGMAYVYWGGRDFPRTNATRLRLAPPEPRDGARFGWSLAVSGGVVAIGAPFEDADGMRDSGAVYAYRFAGRVPGPPRRITQNSPGVPGNSEPGDGFGWSLALGKLGGRPDGVDLAVGAPHEDNDGAGAQTGATGTGLADAGAVTVLRDPLDGRGWYRGQGWDLTRASAATPNPGAARNRPGDWFGHSLAYGEAGGVGYLAAGVPHADVGAADCGAVVLFRSAQWGDPRPATVIRPPQAHRAAGHSFGYSVAFSRDDLVVGAPFAASGDHPQLGYVQVMPVGSASGGRRVADNGGHVYDHFGWSVGGAGDGWLVIGVPDRGRTGAVALVPPGSAQIHLLSPGDGAVEPAVRGRGGAPTDLDFGATVAG